MQSISVRGIHRESIGWSIGLSILMIVVGLIALAAPLLAGVAVTAIVAWMIILAGGAHLVMAWHVRGAGAHIWEALVGVAYIVAGVFVLLNPLAGLVGLTLALGAYLLVKGLFELAIGFRVRGVPGGGWLLVDAIISIILAILIWAHLPSAAIWAVGTLIGVSILFSGISRLALGMASRRALAV